MGDSLSFTKPRTLHLEASSACQLRCPSCPRHTAAFKTHIGQGFLKAADFRQILDNNRWLGSIELSNYGEMFLNPELLEIIKYAHERGVYLTGDNGANLNNVPEEMLEGLVKYKFHSLTCSIGGASDDTYKIYRVKGKYDVLMNSINVINHFKKKYSSDYPLLAWQFVIFGHNEHELPRARKKAATLGMRFQPKLSWNEDFSPLQDVEFVKKETGLTIVSRKEYLERHGLPYFSETCQQLWDYPQINWDGKVLGCCRNFWGDFGGNAFTEGLITSLGHEKINYARNMLSGKKPARNDIPCTTCEIYLAREAHGRWLQRG
jgi:MoaA/NifB/PqqE/SkfB family radical SAM enzyme